jgi:F-type H+-transporting ATPase subunit gamma
MESLESWRRKIEGAAQLKGIVRTMKAMAASNIGQYEAAVRSLESYDRTVALGIRAYFRETRERIQGRGYSRKTPEDHAVVGIVFGSDTGLAGQFNDTLTDFVTTSLQRLKGKKEVWAVGERVQLLLSEAGMPVAQWFPVPNSVFAITPLVGRILSDGELRQEKAPATEFYVFHNQPQAPAGFGPVMQRWLPLDWQWMEAFAGLKWPSENLPQVIGGRRPVLSALIREFLFVLLFKACAESLASENASRLYAMQRAERNIDDVLEDLHHRYHSLRQSTIDEELFDVVSGFEALKGSRA